MLPSSGRLIALDWGDVRIGLALSDESQILASPLETLVRRAGKRFPMPRFLELVAEHRPVGAVVGLPLTGEGTEEASAAAAREMANAIGRRTGLPIELRLAGAATPAALTGTAASARRRTPRRRRPASPRCRRARRGCVSSVARFADRQEIPLWIQMQLPPDWRDGPLHQWITTPWPLRRFR